MKNKIALDLSNLDREYIGGVTRFSIGLAQGLSNNIPKENFLIISSNLNADFLKAHFPSNQFIVVNRSKFNILIYKFLSVMSWIMRVPQIIELSGLFTPKLLKSRLRGWKIIVPTSVINFYNIPCDILCIHDIQHEVHKENFTLKEIISRWGSYRLSATRAGKIQVSSGLIAKNIHEYYGEKILKKVIKIYEGFNPEIFNSNALAKMPEKLQRFNAEFIYYPANLWVHKDHNIVIEGISKFNRKNSKKIGLVLTGKTYQRLQDVSNKSKEYNVDLIHLGIVEDEEMRWLYRKSICVVAAGYHESSSLPLREAIACGGRVVAADIPPNQEVCGLGGVELFKTSSPDSFSKSLENIILCNLKKEGNIDRKERMVIEDFEWNKQSIAYINMLKS